MYLRFSTSQCELKILTFVFTAKQISGMSRALGSINRFLRFYYSEIHITNGIVIMYFKFKIRCYDIYFPKPGTAIKYGE